MMPGYQNSKRRPNRNLKGGSQLAPDVKALSGAETFASEENMQLFAAVEGGDYGADINFGLNMNKLAAENSEDTQGTDGFSKGNTLGKPNLGNRTSPKKGDPTPGGGW